MKMRMDFVFPNLVIYWFIFNLNHTQRKKFYFLYRKNKKENSTSTQNLFQTYHTVDQISNIYFSMKLFFSHEIPFHIVT